MPPNKISKEKELLEALERHEKITAALASNGHVRVSAMDGTLVYALWE